MIIIATAIVAGAIIGGGAASLRLYLEARRIRQIREALANHSYYRVGDRP